MHIQIDAAPFPICIINAYAPQAGASMEEKNKFYDELEKRYEKFRKSHRTYIMGDFNARIHYVLEAEKDTSANSRWEKGKNTLIIKQLLRLKIKKI